MSWSLLLDLLLVVLLVGYAGTGFRQGLFVGLLSLLGFVVGALRRVAAAPAGRRGRRGRADPLAGRARRDGAGRRRGAGRARGGGRGGAGARHLAPGPGGRRGDRAGRGGPRVRARAVGGGRGGARQPVPARCRRWWPGPAWSARSTRSSRTPSPARSRAGTPRSTASCSRAVFAGVEPVLPVADPDPGVGPGPGRGRGRRGRGPGHRRGRGVRARPGGLGLRRRARAAC